MREIKFRAGDKDEGKMFVPWMGDANDDMNREIADIAKKYPLMQFTGLKDKNGKEIYEGDLFPCHYAKDGCKEQPMEVVYHKDRFTFRRRGICQQPAVTQSVNDHEGWRGEVIGNIYENPELLKE